MLIKSIQITLMNTCNANKIIIFKKLNDNRARVSLISTIATLYLGYTIKNKEIFGLWVGMGTQDCEQGRSW